MAKGLLGFIQSLFGTKKGPKSCCKDCVSILYPVIDGEATEEEINYLNEHIHECSPCFKHYEIEKAVKEVVKHRIEKREVPANLLDCIKSKLNG
jgi:anti-sigma factor (TIGR02949 family)